MGFFSRSGKATNLPLGERTFLPPNEGNDDAEITVYFGAEKLVFTGVVDWETSDEGSGELHFEHNGKSYTFGGAVQYKIEEED